VYVGGWVLVAGSETYPQNKALVFLFFVHFPIKLRKAGMQQVKKINVLPSSVRPQIII
jgi:hypothetical protein